MRSTCNLSSIDNVAQWFKHGRAGLFDYTGFDVIPTRTEIVILINDSVYLTRGYRY